MSNKQKVSKIDDGYLAREVDKEFLFPLSEADKAKKADLMAVADSEIGKLEKELDDHKKRINALILPLERDRRKVSEAVLAGEETRLVKCKMEMDFVTAEVKYVYNGKVMETRSMESHELQQEIALPAKKTKKRYPGNGKNSADFKKAASGDKDLPEENDIAAVIRNETNRRTKSSATDGPRGA